MKKNLLILLFLFSLKTWGQNNPPIANPDSLSVFSGQTLSVFKPLLNDTDPDGNILTLDTFFHTEFGKVSRLNQSQNLSAYNMIRYTADSFYFGVDTVWYIVCDDGVPSLCDTGIILANVNYFQHPVNSQLDINNINAGINCDGSQFWNFSTAKFEVPKGEGTHSIFAAALWIGGKTSSNGLHLAATRFNQIGKDSWPGPITNSFYYSNNQDTLWNKVWKINKSEIDTHINKWNQPGYNIPQTFLTWPAHGDTSIGQAYYLAPFYDKNGDGKYNPANGDYPIIKGDQAIYFILNDDRNLHTESGGNKIGAEFHITAYAFDCMADSALWNTMFLNYRIINRSQETYYNSYIGMWVDADLGCPTDDYVACDVQRGSFYFYNGDNLDEDCLGASGYGANPPAQAVTFLAGPRQIEDGFDNSVIYDYNLAVGDNGISYEGLGYGYGDGIADNERLGLTSFLYHNNDNSVKGDPQISTEYYNYMSNKWRDGSQMVYGGTGHQSDPSSDKNVFPKYMFPGNTDPLGWGTGGVPQPVWDEASSGNTPYDRRGVGASGPFTFKPGETQEFDVAFVFGRDYQTPGATAGVSVMRQHIDAVREMFMKDSTTCGGKFSSNIYTLPKVQNSSFAIYPNPATEFITLSFSYETKNATYEIYDLTGRKMEEGKIVSMKQDISLKNYGRGIYLLKVSDEKNIYTKKVVKQ